MRKTFFLFGLLFIYIANAQPYINGGLGTGTITKSGIVAQSGHQWAELQHDIADPTVTNVNWGAAIDNPSFPARYADDFVIPSGQTWHLTQVDVFATINNTQMEVMPFESMGFEIWNGDPSQPGSQKIYGDIMANVFDAIGSGYSGYDHIQNTLFTPTIAPRPIWRVRGNVDVTLPAGNYWVFFRFMTFMDSATIRVPGVIIEGKRGLPTFNSKYNRPQLGFWNPLVDAGNLLPAQLVPMDYPFILHYTPTMGIEEQNHDALTAYPNPAEDVLFLKSKTFETSQSNIITVFDMRGVNVYTENVSGRSDQIQLDVSALQSGLYVVQVVFSDGNSSYTKITKK